jgi:probable F420-dependent oxidoreductase
MVKQLRFGIMTPLVTMLPDIRAAWEENGSIEDLAAIVRAAERFGYHHVTCSEHVVIPVEVAEIRGGRYWDPLATFGYLSAVTTTIRFVTNVLVLGYHHPLEIVKRYGTLDRISGGRLILGLGVGSLQQEFDLLGAPFEDRGVRADEALRALRSSFGQLRPEFEGHYYRFSDIVVDPPGIQCRVPMWIGGRTARSLRRAVEVGDGWMPFGMSADELATLIARAKETTAWSTRGQPLELVLANNSCPADPVGDPGGARQISEELLDAGATMLQLRLVSHSVPHYIEQLEAMAAVLSDYQV